MSARPNINSVFEPLEVPSWPIFAQDEIDAATRVLRSGRVNYWTGQYVRQFEQEFSAYCQREFALATANGTLALETAMAMLDLAEGDEVILPARGFIACASCIVRLGGVPVFADIDSETQNICVISVRNAITPRTKAVLAIHLGGLPAAVVELEKLCQEHNLYLVEDASQAHGAQVDGRPTGSFGDISVFSFCHDKILTTAGEGGMVLTNSQVFYARGVALREHGMTLQVQAGQLSATQAISTEFKYERTSVGSNFRMTELQAVIGCLQLSKLKHFVDERTHNASILDRYLAPLPAVFVPAVPTQVQHAYYRYYMFIRHDRLRDGWSRDRILERLVSLDVPAQPGACPELYLEPCMFRYWDGQVRSNARLLASSSIALLVHPGIDEATMLEIGQRTHQVLTKATKA